MIINEKYEADRQMITVLFATLKQAIPKRPVAITLQDSLRKEIAANGIKFLALKVKTLSRQIWAGGNAQKTETYFQSKDGKSYVVTIPGYRVYVASIFELALNDWRDKQVFRFNWQNIKSLAVTYPTEPKRKILKHLSRESFLASKVLTQTLPNWTGLWTPCSIAFRKDFGFGQK